MAKPGEKKTRRPNRSREAWAQDVAAWRQSCQKLEPFAAERDLNPLTLLWWATRIEKHGGRPRPASKKAKAAFLPVVVARDATVAPRSEAAMGTFEVVLTNGRQVRIPVSFDVTVVARLADALEGVTRC